MAEAPSIPSSSSSIRPSRIKITTAGLPSKSSTNGWKGRGPSPNNRQQQRLKSQETIMASTDHLTDEEFVTILKAETQAHYWRLFNLGVGGRFHAFLEWRSEEHTSELQSLMRNSYAVFCWNKK